jgi:inosose dehydratase
VAAVSEFSDRIWHVHFKDCDLGVVQASRDNEWDGPTSVGHGVFCELGKGGVDFAGVLAALEAIHYTGWIVVEQDVLPGMGTPRESARRNREYLRSLAV